MEKEGTPVIARANPQGFYVHRKINILKSWPVGWAQWIVSLGL